MRTKSLDPVHCQTFNKKERKRMEFVVCSDLHFCEHSVFSEVRRDGENIFIWIVKDVLRQIREYMTENNIPFLIHAGDLFDSRNRIPVKLIAIMQEDLYKFDPMRVFLLRGTSLHDGEGDSYNGRLFRHLNNVQVFNVSDFWYPDEKGYAFYFLPYDTKENMIATIKDWSTNTARQKLTKIIFGHAGLDGAKVSTGIELPGGPSFSRNDLKCWDWGFWGHFHLYQEVWKNFFQIGSPYRIDFAERNDPKGFLHFRNGKVSFVKLDVPDMEQIIIDQNFRPYRGKVEGKFLKFVISGNDSFIKKMDQIEIKKQFMGLGALGVRFETQRIEDEEKVREVRIRKEDAPEDMLSRYIDFMQEAKQMEGLNLKMIKRIGLEAMKGEE